MTVPAIPRRCAMDVSPHGRVLAAAVVQHDNRSGRDVVDVVADSPRGRAGRTVQNRERPARHPEPVIERLDVQALTGDAQPVQRVADGGRVEFRRALNI